MFHIFIFRHAKSTLKHAVVELCLKDMKLQRFRHFIKHVCISCVSKVDVQLFLYPLKKALELVSKVIFACSNIRRVTSIVWKEPVYGAESLLDLFAKVVCVV